MPRFDPRPLLPPGLMVEAIEVGADTISIACRPRQGFGYCPTCGGRSSFMAPRMPVPSRDVYQPQVECWLVSMPVKALPGVRLTREASLRNVAVTGAGSKGAFR